MYITNTQCCAVCEIGSLSQHKTPVIAMKTFCTLLANGRRYIGTMKNPYGFYIFTGVVEHTDNSPAERNFTYGPDFAAYIIKNKLGSVSESVPMINRANHPNHVVKVWVWAPDPENLAKWHAKHKRKVS